MEKRFQISVDLGDSPEDTFGLWIEVILNPEGIIVDVYHHDEDDMADCMATGCHTWDELGLIQPQIDVQKLVDAAKEADKFFQQNDDFTENGEFPIPEFIQDLRDSIAEVTK